ncbi:FG-GAP-like repeat-containing protein [Flexithrix dorotheae]|uniref:FG-GAP-like repeat-containing protein n=1 Tax=Flexithrix dorotheae TaxID=70993 RepID=UPI00036DBA0A|nr:FG-GAP-like repeat-containing protein [Flexithrix dorotheae]
MKLKFTFSILIILSGLKVFGQKYDRIINIDLSTEPSAYAIADLNNNGYEEVVTAFKNKDFISIVANDSGFLNPPFVVDTKTESTINHILLDDINNDKFKDIIFSDFENNRIGVQINKGDLEFEGPVFFSTGKKPKKSMAQDFNGDGLNDLVVINEEGNSISLFYFDKEKLLSDPIEISTGAIPNDIEIRDMDGDGFVDLLVVCKNGKMVSIYYGNNNGFSSPVDMLFEFNPINIEIDDLDEDGKLDCVIVFAEENQIQIIYGSDNREFEDAEKWVSTEFFSDLDFVIDDYNEDGFKDIMVSSYYHDKRLLKITLFKSDGKRGFKHQTTSEEWTNHPIIYFGFSDLTKIGRKGFLMGTPYYGKMNQFFLNEEFDFYSYREIFIWNDFNKLDIGDINNDGVFDIVTANFHRDYISIYKGNIDGSFSFIKNYMGIELNRDVGLVDLNNDGLLDILEKGDDPGYFFNKGNCEFQFINLSESNFNYGITTTKVDFNKDGYYDILGLEGVFLNLANDSFNLAHKFDYYSTDAKPLDFNNDSIIDLVYYNYYLDKITLLSGIGDGTFKNVKEIILKDVVYINTGDFNQDGFDDLVVTFVNPETRQYEEGAVLFASETEIFSNELHRFPRPRSSGEVVLDVDRDNKVEIVFPTYKLEYYNVETDSIITPRRFVTEEWFSVDDVFPLDYNKDGLMDIVTTSGSFANQINILTNKLNGEITFSGLEWDYNGKPIDSLVSINPSHLAYTVLYNDSELLPLEAGTYNVSVKIKDKTYTGSSDTTLTINKVPLLIKADTISKIYGEEVPELTFSFDSLRGYDTKYHIDELPTISTSADDTSDVGLFPIILTGGSDRNYIISLQNGIMEVKAAPLKIIASDIEINEGNLIPELNYTFDGFVNGDNESDLDKKPSIKIEEESVPLSPGEYTINVSGAEDKNYTITFQNGLLVINAVTGLEDEYGNSLIQVYPNPVRPNQPFSIKAPQNVVFEIYDVQGNKLLSKKMEDEIENIQLKQGLYFLKFLDYPSVHKILVD